MSAKKKLPPEEAAPHLRLPLKWRVVITVFVAFHLLAVFTPPFSLRVNRLGFSPVAQTMLSATRWYIDFGYLNHGYAFFAPDPGPSHLVHYKLEFEDGRKPIERTFPDLKRHFPRLLYHRHFMLAEQLNDSFTVPQPPAGPPPRREGVPESEWKVLVQQWEADKRNWKEARDIYLARWKNYEQHLLHHYGASKVTMQRIEHRIPFLDVAQRRGVDLHAEDLYWYAGRDDFYRDPTEGSEP